MAPLDAADLRNDDPTAFVRETGEVKALDLAVEGAHCAGCIAKIETGLKALDLSLIHI